MFIKRVTDIFASILGLVITLGPMVFLWIISALLTHSGGIFCQKRIGRYGRTFVIYKFRTMHAVTNHISVFSAFMRKSKFDELPQLFNVLIGDMSIVGPRPDVPGYYDKLEEKYSKLLELRPGITGPASLKYSNEDELLLQYEDDDEYNDRVIFPDKLRINMLYYEKQSLLLDLKIIYYTLFRLKYSDEILTNS